MKQVIQHLKSGQLELLDMPCPVVAPGHLLVQTRASVISAGTEKMLVEFARGGLLAKARQQPERVRQAIEKVKTDGLLSTVDAIRNRLDQPIPLGYSSAGRVVAVGADVAGIEVGDRVASNGPHAEVAHVPMNLCAKIPEKVGDADAAFSVLGAISLQGVRLLKPELGETVTVYGLGLLGLLAVQLLVNSGVKVIGIDIDDARLDLAESFGAIPINAASYPDVAPACRSHAPNAGVDGVLITASSQGDDIIHQSAEMSRQRGRIVLVGVVDMQLDRADFYQKELSFQVSCSYGPGRYDPQYEKQGVDYPQAFVRWTEQRNIAAVVELMAAGKLDLRPLVSQLIPHNEAERAYDLLTSDPSQMAIVLDYPDAQPALKRVAVHSDSASVKAGSAVVGVIGAGQFTRGTLLPALRKTDARIKSIASAGGLSAATLAKKFSIESATSDHQTILDDAQINTVVIATRHDSHARLAAAALAAGKHVFVEKPLAIDRQGLRQVRAAHEQSEGLQLLVGFNRRFAPLSVKMLQLLAGRTEPATGIVTINAGQLPADHWALNPQIGGGRIIGEACHWIDLLVFLFESEVTSAAAISPGDGSISNQATITLNFADGSIGTIHYLADGHRSFPKERIEIFTEGSILKLDNFRRLRAYGTKNFHRQSHLRQNKGHQRQFEQFIQTIQTGGPPIIPPEQLWNVTEATLAAGESSGVSKPIDETNG